MPQDLVDFLGEIEFLRGSSREFRELIAKELGVVQVARREEVFADEAPGDAVYFISEGSIQIKKTRLHAVHSTPRRVPW